MALFPLRRGRTRTPVVSSIHAAAKPIVLSGEKRTEAWFKTREDWQTRVWEFYDEIGECRQAARSMGDVFARVPWYAGVRPDPEAAPLPLFTEDDEDYQAQQEELPPEFQYTPDEAFIVSQTLADLASPIGGQSEIRRQIGVSLFCPGECFLVGEPVISTEEGSSAQVEEQRWDVRSTDELEIDWNQRRRNSVGDEVPTVKIKDAAGKKRDLSPDAVVIRIWRPHPRFQAWADSPMRSALGICEELLILTQAIKSAALSRAAGRGMLFLPNSMRDSVAANPGEDGEGDAARTDTVIADTLQAVGEAIQDPSSAYAQVPVIFFVNDDVYEKIANGKPLITWDREVDRIAAEQREELLTRFANAIDWPAELLTGKAGLNHWTAWLLRDEAFQSNAEPFIVLAVDAITNWYLLPALRAAGVERPERFCTWYQAVGVVSDPDEGTKANTAGENMLISWSRWRRSLGFTDDDAPSDDELRQRIAIAAFMRNPNLGSLPTLAPQGEAGPPVEPVDVPSEVAPPAEAAAIEAPAVFAAQAADDGAALPALAAMLNDLDATLFVQAHERADDAMRRALEKANARLRTLARSDRQTFDLVKSIDASTLMVAPTLGPAICDRLTGADGDGQGEDVLAGAFLAYLTWYDDRLARADAEVVAMLREQGIPESLAVQAERDLAQKREESHNLLYAALLTLAASLIRNPAKRESAGEDGGSLVPPGLVRDALIRAGGGGTQAASFITGDLIKDLFRQADVEFQTFVWKYGDPSMRRQSFQPHRRLAGVMFHSQDDDVLGNQGGGWPHVSHFWPGDHKGCLCRVELLTVRRAGVQAPPRQMAPSV